MIRPDSHSSSNGPLVSVIIPVFNTEAYIAHAVNSALQQTMSNLEVIVVNDASTDCTLAQIEDISDSRLRIIDLAENRGVAAARNRAIYEATGEWIAILDSDDWFAPERLDVLLKVAADTRADMVADDLWFINDGETLPWTTQLAQSGKVITETIQIHPDRFVRTDIPGRIGLNLGLSKPLIRRRLINELNLSYDENLITDEDFFLYLDCLIVGARFVLFPQPYYYYRLNRHGSLTTKGGKVERFDLALAAMKRRLGRPEVICHDVLHESVRHRIDIYLRYLAYYKVVEPLKKCEWIDVVKALVENPQVIINLATRLPEVVLSRYWQRSR